MKIKTTHQLDHYQIKVVYKLWNTEYPKNLIHQNLCDFENYLKPLSNQCHWLLVDKNGAIKGWYFNFTRTDEKWFAMILASEIHGKEFGTLLLNEAKKRDSILNGWVIDKTDYQKQNGDSYKSPLQFYIKNEFHILPKIRLETAEISAVKIRWEK